MKNEGKKHECEEGEYGGQVPVGERWTKGTTPALTKDYGTKNDGELQNDLTPSVRKTGPI